MKKYPQKKTATPISRATLDISELLENTKVNLQILERFHMKNILKSSHKMDENKHNSTSWKQKKSLFAKPR